MKKSILCIVLIVALVVATIPLVSMAGDDVLGIDESTVLMPVEVETGETMQTAASEPAASASPSDETKEKAPDITIEGSISKIFDVPQGHNFSDVKTIEEMPFLDVKADAALAVGSSFFLTLENAEWSFSQAVPAELGSIQEGNFTPPDGSYTMQMISPAQSKVLINTEDTMQLHIPMITKITGAEASVSIQDTDEGVLDTEVASFVFNRAQELPVQETPPVLDLLPAAPQANQALELTAQNAAPQGAVDVRTYFPGGNGSILSNMQLSFQDSLGNAMTNPTITSSIGFTFGINIPQTVTAQIQNGDYYKISLPNMVLVPYAINNVALYDNSATPVQYGSFSVGTDNVMTITFTNAAQSSNGLIGNLYFKTNFNTNAGLVPGTQTLTLTDENSISAQFTLIPQTKNPLMIEGDGTHGDDITWTITLNTNLSTLTNAQLTERWPSSLLYDPANPVKVYSMDVDVYGAPIPGSEVLINPASGLYTADANGNVNFANPISTAYRLVYTTTVKPLAVPSGGGKLDFLNTATLTATELATSLSVQRTVSKTFYALVELVNTAGYLAPTPQEAAFAIPFTQTFGWLLRYNYQQNSIATPVVDVVYDPTPTDGNLLALNLSSVTVYPVSIVNDVPVRGNTPLDPSEYTISQSPGAFRITFTGPINSAYGITYQTYAPDIVLQSFNKATTASADDGSGLVTSTNATYVWQQVIGKSVTDVDLQNSYLSWRISLNLNEYTMDDLTVTDVLSSGHTYIDGSLTIVDTKNNTTLRTDDDYSFRYDGATQTMTIVFQGRYATVTDTLEIMYQTDYSAGTVSSVFSGTAQAAWNGNTAQAYAEYNATQPEQNNGVKYGSYNANTGEITWVILVDYANTGLQNASIKDPIINAAGTDPNTWQQFVRHSTRVYYYTIDNDNGDPNYAYAMRGSEINYSDVAIAEPDVGDAEPTLNVQFVAPQAPPVKYWVEYKTKVNTPDGNGNYYIMSRYANKATFVNDFSPTRVFDATVNINHGGKAVEISGNQGRDGYAHWSVLVNPAQSAFSNLQITNTPSVNQTIQTNSIVVYPGLVDQNGTVTADTQHPLTAGTDYSFTYAPTGTSGTMQLVVNLYPAAAVGAYTSSKVYVVNYSASIAMAQGEAVDNTVQVSSAGSPDMTSSAYQAIPINVTNAGGILVGKRISSFSIKKTGDAGEPMTGVVLQIFDKNGNQVGGSYTTEANGVITVNNAVTGTYYLKELSTLPGYAISDALYNGTYQISVDQATREIAVTNARSMITIPVRGNAQPLQAGLTATYDLYQMAGGTYRLYTSNIVSDANSNVVLRGLDVGSYELRQTAPPNGFIKNTQPVAFDVVLAGGTQVLSGEVTLNSYQGTFSFKKTDNRSHPIITKQPVSLIEAGNRSGSSPEPLPGVTFTITNVPGTAFYTATAVSAGDGTVTFENLSPGKYEVTETQGAPGWPMVGNAATLTVTIPSEAEGQTGIAFDGGTVTNNLSNGSVEIMVTDALGNPLAGAVFAIYDDGNNVRRTGIVTNTNGIALATGLEEGDYSAVQIQAPEGYLRNPSPTTFALVLADMDNDPVFAGTLIDYRASAVLQKQDEEGNGLDGAVFTLTNIDTNTVVGDAYVTDADGTLELQNLGPGSYALAENQAPDGFVLDTTPFLFVVPQTAASEPAQIPLNNGQPFVNYKASVSFVKTDEKGNPLANVSFRLTRTDNGAQPDVTDYVSDGDGRVTMQELATGSYCISETIAADGYILNTQPKTFTLDGTQKVVALDAMVNYQGKVRLLQTDGQGNPLKGAVFSLSPQAKPFFSLFPGTKETYTTDRNGLIEVEGLAPGAYVFEQIAAPEGFLPADGLDTLAFRIEAEAEGKPAVVELQTALKRWGGTIDVLKTDEAGAVLGGAQFKLLDGKGNVLRAGIETSDRGTAVVSGLDPGVYQLAESKAPQGYSANVTPHTVTLEYEPDNTQQEQANIKLTVVNVRMPDTPTPPEGGDIDAGTADTGTQTVNTSGSRTGDTTDYMGYIVLAVLAAATIAVFVWGKRKSRSRG